jgi:2-polyprenyl-3-methyl-5-hydroxy-6-metoxy-1,4-benzoquinol methylase
VRPSELAAGLASNEVEIIDLKGMTYRPFEDDWRLSEDLAINYLAFSVKLAS